jgi:hypothetical protein
VIKPDAPAHVDRAIEHRILIARSLYALGMAMCVISNFMSIAFIFLVQIYYAVAPHLRQSRRRQDESRG